MRILILTGKFCMGHWSASQSLAQAVQARTELPVFPLRLHMTYPWQEG